MAKRGSRTSRKLLRLWTAAVFVFLYLPVVLLVVYSFNASRLNVRFEGFTLRWYGEVFHSRPLLAAMKNTLIIATAATALSVPLGTIGAWLLYRYRFRFMRLISTLIFIPMIMPEIVMGVSMMIFFVATAAAGNAMIVRLTGDEDAGTAGLGFVTVIIAHVTFCFPFVMAAVQARLAGLDPALEEAAMDLGATPVRAFCSVLVPYLLPAIISGALMAFTLSIDELIVTYFTNGPESVTLPQVIYGRARVGLDPSLDALSALFLVATVLLVGMSEYLRKRAGRAGGEA